MKYNHKEIEKKWQKKWEESDLYKANDLSDQEKKYILDMFPYPSGAGLHVGHVEGYTATDIYSRFLRMQGKFNVLHPIGWDAFGLPAENYAIKTGTHPDKSTHDNIKNFTKQLKSLGLSYDWNREIDSSSKEYYKWTQWFFLLLYKNGLAYKKKAKVNWCDSCNTVLANEQAEGGKCERCDSEVVQKDLSQWFFKITDFVDDQIFENKEIKGLINGLDTIDWPESTKIAQKNWIGRSEGARVKFEVKSTDKVKKDVVEVFTTRPDTLFGATYFVVAPEHHLITNYQLLITNYDEVEAYVLAASKKTELERTDLAKDKTGVKLDGVVAINPVNGEEIPIFVADYVLSTYGTGAIMAVPAHDERDYEFAKKYELDIKEVVAKETGTVSKDAIKKRGGCAIVFDPKSQKYAVLERKDGIFAFFSGGANKRESLYDCVQRELLEESGFYNYSHVESIAHAYTNYYNSVKKHRVCGEALCNLIVLKNTDRKKLKLEDHEQEFKQRFVSADEILNNWKEKGHNDGSFDHWRWFLKLSVARLIELGFDKVSDENLYKHEIFTDNGRAINSDFLNGLTTKEAKKKIISWLEEKGLGERQVNYRLRDWLVSRQRYWGSPIPIIYCDVCGEVPVREEDLPIELPTDVDFKPTGESPLNYSKTFHDCVCPKCGMKARRESDTMDTFVCSSWYYFRFADPKNVNEFAGKEALKAWLPVDTYVGGAEHTVLHLLYSRFFTKVLQKYGYIDFNEPFIKLRHQGIILAEDGNKMSKSKGNVINPDTVIEEYGADTLRMYEMFMGPLEDSKPWNTKGIVGVRRFLEKIVKLESKIKNQESSKNDVKILLHKTIKKVTEDISWFKFNTAIAQMMMLVNAWEKEKEVERGDFEKFILILAPFAPHLCEEIWESLGNKESIFKAHWPEYDPELIKDKKIKLVVQVNGKLRNTIEVEADISEEEALKIAKTSEKIQKWTQDKEIVKEIFVKGKLVNIVVK